MNNLTDETYTYLNPVFDQRDGLVERAIDDCTKYFNRFKYKCIFVTKCINQTHATTYFTLSNKFENQNEELSEPTEITNEIDEFEEGESSHMFASITKLTKKNV